MTCAWSLETSIFISRTSDFQSGTMVSARFFQPQSSSLRRSQGLKKTAHTARNVSGAARTKLAIVLAMNRTLVTPMASSLFFEPGGPTGAVASVALVALVAFVVGAAGVESITSGSANTYAAPATPSGPSVPTARPSR